MRQSWNSGSCSHSILIAKIQSHTILMSKCYLKCKFIPFSRYIFNFEVDVIWIKGCNDTKRALYFSNVNEKCIFVLLFNFSVRFLLKIPGNSGLSCQVKQFCHLSSQTCIELYYVCFLDSIKSNAHI